MLYECYTSISQGFLLGLIPFAIGFIGYIIYKQTKDQ